MADEFYNGNQLQKHMPTPFQIPHVISGTRLAGTAAQHKTHRQASLFWSTTGITHLRRQHRLIFGQMNSPPHSLLMHV